MMQKSDKDELILKDSSTGRNSGFCSMDGNGSGERGLF